MHSTLGMRWIDSCFVAGTFCLQLQKYTDTQTRKHANTQTHRHTDTDTHTCAQKRQQDKQRPAWRRM